MKSKLLCMALLCTAGCAGTMQATPTIHGEAPALAVQDDKAGPPGIAGWIPGIFDDLWDTVSANVGTGYGAGAHIQVTTLARVGVGEYADFAAFGIGSGIFHGNWENPFEPYSSTMWDAGIRVGVGFGAYATLHTWQVLDLASSIVGFGYWSLDGD